MTQNMANRHDHFERISYLGCFHSYKKIKPTDEIFANDSIDFVSESRHLVGNVGHDLKTVSFPPFSTDLFLK
jgi:hypothetical protein